MLTLRSGPLLSVDRARLGGGVRRSFRQWLTPERSSSPQGSSRCKILIARLARGQQSLSCRYPATFVSRREVTYQFVPSKRWPLSGNSKGRRYGVEVPLSTIPAGIIVPTFPQRSPPRLLTAAAAVVWNQRPDRRIRRALLHLQYSYAPPFGPAILVTQGTLSPFAAL